MKKGWNVFENSDEEDSSEGEEEEENVDQICEDISKRLPRFKTIRLRIVGETPVAAALALKRLDSAGRIDLVDEDDTCIYSDVIVRGYDDDDCKDYEMFKAFKILHISSKRPFRVTKETTNAVPNCSPLAFKTKLFLSHHFFIETNHEREKEWMRKITIVRSCRECAEGILSESAKTQALRNLREYGLCVIPRLFSKSSVLELSSLALADMKQALERLRKLDDIDLLDPNVALKKAVDNYHEIATREALRCDLRKGPRMSKWEKNEKKKKKNSPPSFTSKLPCIVDMITEVFCPIQRPDLEVGNWGKWNFGSHGPGTKTMPCIGKMGSVISFPGSRSQAIHADTPHLFSVPLPPHYVNMFCPGVENVQDVRIGQTAFFAKTHRLSESSKMVSSNDESVKRLEEALVRPHLEPGDAVFFDTRILHFGTPNTGKEWRPILYVNYTQPWFARERTDKNWGRTSLFE